MSKFQRETATYEEDLPHRFRVEVGSAAAGGCGTCGAPDEDPRHVSWEREKLAEQAAARHGETFPREFGS